MFSDVLFLVFSMIVGYYASSGVKSQFVRIIDITLYTGILLYISQDYTGGMRYILLFMSGTTFAYNMKNYLYNKSAVV